MNRSAVLLFASVSIVAQSHADDTNELVFARKAFGEMDSVYSISRQVADRLPQWNGQTNEPPLSVFAAMQIARQDILRRGGFEPRDTLEITGVSLLRSSSDVDLHLWFYFVDFECGTWSKVQGELCVLMDGTVVTRRCVPARRKH